MKNRERFRFYFSKSRKQNLLTSVFFLLFVLYRIYFLPGIEFSQSIFDDEVAWQADRKSRSLLNWVLYRDAPGYFVVIPRLLFVLAEVLPVLQFEVSLRLLVTLCQAVCLLFASHLIKYFTKMPQPLIYCTLLSVWIEDINYLHNVGYFFLFPIFYLISMKKSSQAQTWLLYIVAALLISKPITAILILFFVSYQLLKSRNNSETINKIPQNYFILFYCALYLGLYFVLPNRWETPFTSNLGYTLPALANVSWAIGMTLLPFLYIGLQGLLVMKDQALFLPFFGLFLYLLPWFWFSFQRKRLLSITKDLASNLGSLSLMLLLSYLSTYSLSNIAWITRFPLWTDPAPQLLWGLWNSTVPILILLLIFGSREISKRVQTSIALVVIMQNSLLQIVAKQYLERGW